MGYRQRNGILKHTCPAEHTTPQAPQLASDTGVSQLPLRSQSRRSVDRHGSRASAAASAGASAALSGDASVYVTMGAAVPQLAASAKSSRATGRSMGRRYARGGEDVTP